MLKFQELNKHTNAMSVSFYVPTGFSCSNTNTTSFTASTNDDFFSIFTLLYERDRYGSIDFRR